jgi:hypothetical protein
MPHRPFPRAPSIPRPPVEGADDDADHQAKALRGASVVVCAGPLGALPAAVARRARAGAGRQSGNAADGQSSAARPPHMVLLVVDGRRALSLGALFGGEDAALRWGRCMVGV